MPYRICYLKPSNDEKFEEVPVRGEVRITRRRSLMMKDYKPLNESPFDVLPNEIILNICNLLDQETLKKAVLIDRRFNKIITQSASTMSRLPLTVGTFEGPENHALQNFKRRYKEVNFECVLRNRWLKYVKNYLTKLGEHVNVVTLNNCQLPREGLSFILSSFPQLKTLKIFSHETLKVMESLNDEPLDPNMFPHLIRIQLERVHSVLKFFINLQLKYLQILRLEGEDWNHLNNFLKNQKSLRTLTLIDCRKFPNNLEIPKLQPGLTIQTLSFLFLQDFNVEKFVEYLMTFDNHIRCLTIIRVKQFGETQKIFEAILENFRGLLSLAVDFDHFPISEHFYRHLIPNRNLVSLAVNSRVLNNPNGFRGIFSVYPAISNLSISISKIGVDMKIEDFEFMFETLKNLRTFYLVLTISTDLNHGFFKNITSLNIIDCHNDFDWSELGKSSPNLKTLVLPNLCSHCKFDLKYLLMNLKALTHLEIGERFKVTKSEMKIFKAYAPQLRVLKVLKTSWCCKGSPQEILDQLELENLQVFLLLTIHENISIYSNTLFFKSPSFELF